MNLSDIFLPLHLTSLAFVVWNVVQADHMGFTWMTGKVDTLNKEKVQKHHTRLWVGLSLMITTGVMLAWPVREYLLTHPQFYIKMAFVITLIANGFIIGALQDLAITRKFSTLSLSEKLPLFISGGLSTLSWIGAATTALFLLP